MIRNDFEIYLNCENPEVVKKYFDLYPFLAGVTTNPAMISRLGRTDYFNILKEIREVIGNKKLFAQVISHDYNEIIEEAMLIRRAGGENTIVKIPAMEFGIKAIHTLTEMGIRTLGTLVCSTIQGVMAIQAGAEIVVPFYFHMKDAGLDPVSVTRELVEYTKVSGTGKVISAAHRTLEEFGECIGLGVHGLTLNPDFITMGMLNDTAVKNLNFFTESWEKVFGSGTKIIDLAK